MLKSIKIGLLTADLDSGNMGCNALTFCAISLLDEIAQRFGMRFNYVLFKDIDVRSVHQYGTLDSDRIKCVPPIITPQQKLRAVLKRQFSILKKFDEALNACDFFFEIAGGDSFSDIYGMKRPLLFERYHSRIRNQNKPLVFLPQTIGPFKKKKVKQIAKRSLFNATHVFARDPISYKKAVQFAKKEHVSQSIDMAFFMDYTPNHKDASQHQHTVGLNPSGLLWNGGYTGKNQFGLKADYQMLVYKIIEILHQSACKVVLVPHVLHGPSYSVEDDYRICKMLMKKYSFCDIAPFFYTPVEAKSYISRLDLMIASRMHCCIGAYSSGVPIYPLAYSRKFKGLFKEELDYPHGAELVSDDIEIMLSEIKEIVKDLPNLKASMTERLEKLTVYKSRFIDELMHLLLSYCQCG